MEVIIFTCLLLASASARHLDEPSYSATPVNITAVPYIALIRLKNRSHGCVASIVHKRFLVTAAHCAGLNPNSSAYFRVTVGTDNSDSGEDVEIEDMIKHPLCNELDYELAVIKLKKDLKFSDRVNLIEMANTSAAPKPGELLKTYGFNYNGKNMPDILVELKTPFVDHQTCKQRLKPLLITVTDRMVCVGEEGKQACAGEGDGGPLVYNNQLIGVLSLPIGCDLHKIPNLYASVPSMLDFIRKTIENNV